MSLDFEVLSTTSIKRKKPWPKCYWLGKEKEQVVLLDSKRISYLNLGNGETKRKVGLLHQFLDEAIELFFCDENVLALLTNGNILIWNKDIDAVYVVKGLPTFQTVKLATLRKKTIVESNNVVKSKYDIAIRSDLRSMAVIVNFSSIFIWRSEEVPQKASSPINTKKPKELHGFWFSVLVENNVTLPTTANDKNAISSVIFNQTKSLIQSPLQCIYSFSTNDVVHLQMLTVTTAYTKNTEPHDNYICVWKKFDFPMKDLHPACRTIQHTGSLVSKLSHDGLCLALAVNQLTTEAARLMFISTLNGSMHATSLKHYAVSQPVTMRKKYLWIAEMVWSADNCFLICITREGSICVASALGELLQIHLSGCSLKLGPSYYLNLYPLVKPASREASQVSLEDDESVISTLSGGHNFKQRFSIASHKKSPLILLSDGYLVTLIRFPKGLVGTFQIASWFLQRAKAALKPFYADYNPEFKTLGGTVAHNPKKTTKATFEVADMRTSWNTLPLALNSTKDESTGSIAISSTSFDWESRQLTIACSNMTSFWGLLCNTNCAWTKAIHSLVSKSVVIFLDIANLSITHQIGFSLQSWETVSNPFNSVIQMVNNCFDLLVFDCVLFNMLRASIMLLNQLIPPLVNDGKCQNLLKKMIKSKSFLLKMELGLVQNYGSRIPEMMYHRVQSKSYILDGFYSGESFTTSQSIRVSNIMENTLIRRLKPAWFYLYKIAQKQYQKCVTENKKYSNVNDWSQIYCSLQEDIQDRGWELTSLNKKKLLKNEKPATTLYLKGHVERAIEMWISELKNAKVSKSRQLHNILYALITEYNVAASLAFVCCLLKGDSVLFKTKHEMPPSDDAKKRILYFVIKRMNCVNITSLVQTFARLWLMYYNKEAIHVYPIHRAHCLLRRNHAYKCLRCCPLISPLLTDSLTSQKVDVLMSPTLVLELLLLGGLWFETVSFLFSPMNNKHFRLAFAIAATWWKANQLIWQARSSIFSAKLDPETILHMHLSNLLSISCKNTKQTTETSSELVHNIRDILLPGVLCDFNLAPIILDDIVENLIDLIKKADLLVPDETYLPAPPIYCPQQSIGYEEGDMPSEETEEGFRHSVANLIEQFFCVIHASSLGFPLMAWYFSFIEKLWASADWNSFGETAFSNLQYTIVTFLDMNSPTSDAANAIQWSTLVISKEGQECLQSIRNLFSLIWMLHCRDQLSLACRSLRKYVISSETRSNEFEDPNYYFLTLDKVLFWCEKISPFRSLLRTSGCLETVIFNAANELNYSETLVRRVARCFPISEDLSLSGTNQLMNLDKKWQSITKCLSSPVNSDSTDNVKSTKTLDFVTYQLQEIKNRESLKSRIQAQFSQLCKSETNLKLENFEDYCFELEEQFLSFIEPVFHIGIIKRLDLNNSVQPSIPLLTTFSKQLKIILYPNENESINSLVNLEKRFSSRYSLLELIELAGSPSTSSVLSSNVFNFLKVPTKRHSVLFRQPIRSFWSPSRRSVERFHRLVTKVRHRQSIRMKFRNKASKVSSAAKWKSTTNLLLEDISRRKSGFLKSISTSNLLIDSIGRPNTHPNKGFASKISDLVVELSMKSNEGNSLLPFISYILSWVYQDQNVTLNVLPSHLLLALVLESKRKMELNKGKLSLVKVKISPGSEVKKSSCVIRSSSLRDPIVKKNQIPVSQIESQSYKYYTLDKKHRNVLSGIDDDLKSIKPTFEEGKNLKLHNENPKKTDKVNITAPLDINANVPTGGVEIKHDINPNEKFQQPSPKKYTLPQVYQESFGNSKTSRNKSSPQKSNKKEYKIELEETSLYSPIDNNPQPSKTLFNRTSPHRQSVIRKTREIKAELPIDKKLPNETIIESSTNSEKQMTNAIQETVRSEIRKSIEEIGLGILGGAIGNCIASSVTRSDTTHLPDQIMRAPERPPRRADSFRSVKTQGTNTQTLPDINQKKLKVTNTKIIKGSSSAESDFSDVSDSSKNKMTRRKKSVLHKIPLLKADTEDNKTSPKRYYVISDENSSLKPSIRESPPRNPKHQKPIRLLKLEKTEEKYGGLVNVNKFVDPQEVRQFVVGKRQKSKERLSEKRLLSISSKPTKTSDKSSGKASQRIVDKSGVNEKDKVTKNVKEELKLPLTLHPSDLPSNLLNPEILTTSSVPVLSPDSCAKLQYEVYERLRSSTQKDNHSTQTNGLVQLASTGGNTDPTITADIGIMANMPSESDFENERIKVFQDIQTKSKHTSISPDFQPADQGPTRDENDQSNLANYHYDISFTSPDCATLKDEIGEYLNDYSPRSSSKSEASTGLSESFCTKLDGLKQRLDNIEKVSQNLEEELKSSKKVIENAEDMANKNLSEPKDQRTKTAKSNDWPKRETNTFEHRKSIILSLLDNNYRAEFTNYESVVDGNKNITKSPKRKISFANNYGSEVQAYDDSYIDVHPISKESVLYRSKSSDDYSFIEPHKKRELYRIYGSKRIPDRVLQKIRSEYIAKRQSSM